MSENKDKSKDIKKGLEDLELKEKLELVESERDSIKKELEEIKKKYDETKELNTKLYLKVTEQINKEPEEPKEDEDPDLISARKKIEEMNKEKGDN